MTTLGPSLLPISGPLQASEVASPAEGGAPPSFATPADLSLPSEGAQVAAVARRLGTPLLPWQQRVADVATERLPDGSYKYRVVVVSVPRQSGKTTLLGAIGVHRAMVLGRDVFYTAQTGKDGRERWGDVKTTLQNTPGIRHRITVRTAAGSERVTFPNGHAFRCFAPTADSLHGYTPPTVMLDESFAHSEAVGELLMGAIGPAQITLLDRQLWIVSTQGTAESTFLQGWIDKAEAGAPRVAGFVWAAPESVDPDKLTPAQVEAYHPAVGCRINGKTMEAEEVIEQRDTNSRAEFVRAYLNRRTLTSSYLIQPDEIRALAEPDAPAPATTDLVLTYDVAHDRSAAAVLATWWHQGVPHSRVVMAGPGYSWVAPAVDDLATSWSPAAVAADDGGHAREVTEALEGMGCPVRRLTLREFSTATGSMLRRIREDDYSHDGTQLLVDAFSGLATRPSSDGEVFSRRQSTGNVAAAVAATVGAQVLEGQPQDQGIQVVWEA